MSHSFQSRPIALSRTHLRSHKRAWFLSALIAGLGLTSCLASPGSLFAQDVNNSTTRNLQTNAIENADGAYNNLSTGVLNFNGPSGAAEWSSDTLTLNNAGAVNLFRANLGIIGDVTNTGTFQIASLGGIVQVDGHFVNSGTSGSVLINGGGMELIGDFGTGTANFTNNSTAGTGVSIATGRYLVADTITNSNGGTMLNSGRIEGRTAINNSGTILSNSATSLLRGTINNNGTIEARGAVEGNVTNAATKAFTLTGDLAQTGDFTNAGTLTVSAGNLTGTDELTNTSTLTIGDHRTVSAENINNNTGGSISVGNSALLTGNVLENNAAITVGAGGSIRSTSTSSGDDLTNHATGTISFQGATGTANLSSGTGTIVNQGTINLNAGTVLVTGNLTDTGTIAMANGTTFKTGSANQSIANSMTLAGTSHFDSNGFDATISGNMAGTGGLAKDGLGNLTLDGNNTFSGPSSINAGQLTLKGGNALRNTTALTVGAAGKLKIENHETIGSLAGSAGSETNLAANLTTGGNNANTTYSGNIIGTGKLAKEGNGTMTLAGSSPNTFTGGVDVNRGTLALSTSEQLGSGTVTIGANGTMDIEANTTQTVQGVTSQGTINNSGTLTSNTNISNTGTLHNLLSTSVINGGITNSDSGLVDNVGTINGGVTNSATLNSNTATSVISGGLTNQGTANLRHQVNGAITNENLPNETATITVEGDLVGNSSLQNLGNAQLHVRDGNFTGITNLTNQSTHAAGVQIDATRTLAAGAVSNHFGSTIVNSGTLQSTAAVDNNGTLTNQSGATLQGGIHNASANALVTNHGTINGGITQNFGTVNSLDNASVINGGVNNSGYVNAQHQISGPIVNNAQHSFTDVTLSHVQANATGTVTFGSGPTAETFSLTAASGSATGAEGNGAKSVVIHFSASIAQAGTSTYDPATDTIDVFVADAGSTSVEDIQDAINNGSGFTASGGTLSGTVSNNGTTNPLTGGRDSGTALIRILADATGAAAQNKTVAILEDHSITADSALASIDATTGNITVRVHGEVGYDDIASAINDLNGFNASVTTSIGDQGYMSSLDTPPASSTLTNGVFNVEGNLAADSSFTNGGHLHLNNGNLTGLTSLSNSGDILVQDGYLLQANTLDNTTGVIELGYDATLEADTISNNSRIDVYGQGDIVANGTISNFADGRMTFGMGTTTTNERSELSSASNSIVNQGTIVVANGVLVTTGNVSGSGTLAMGNGTTLESGNANQSISNNMAIADGGTATFNSAGHNASLSGTVSGNGQFVKSGVGNLTLSGNNTFTGPAIINNGQLTLQGGNAIADSTAVQLNTGSLNVSSTETIGSLATSANTQVILDSSLTTGGNLASTTSSGLISGSGGLVKQGTGTMTLSGTSANTFAGGTTISGGTLAATTSQQLGTGNVNVGTTGTLTTGNNTTQSVAGLTNQGTLTLGSNAILNTGTSHFTNAGTVNVGTNASIIDSGTITNSGTLNFSGGTATLSSGTNVITNTGSINLNAGTVLVKGNLSGNGLINMNNGTTLRSGNANQQIANGIRVNSGTAVIDTNGNNVNLTGSIAGSGTLNKVGVGDLTWVGVNNGNAIINSGLMITSTQSQTGNVQISNGSGVIFSQNSNGTYAGNVTGNGSFTKSGSGTVTMTGNSVYTGGTNVVDGTLRVGIQGTGQVQSHINVANGGTLGGGGTVIGNVSTQQGGRLAAGNSIGTLTVNGNLNASGSVIENELNGTTSDLINVTGSANITNASLVNQFDSSASYATRMYRGLNATGGLTGRFQNVSHVNAPSNFLISTYYTPTTANVVLTSLADATLASSTSTALLSSSQDYLTSIMTQMNNYQLGGLGMLPGNFTQRAERNVWFKGIGNFNNIGSAGVIPGYSANTSGGIVGIDRATDSNTRIGIAAGYTLTDLNMRNAAKATSAVNSARLSLYGAHSFDYVTLSGIGGYAYHDVEGERRLVGIGTALGKQSQNEASLNFQLTANPNLEGQSLLPYVGIQWVHLEQGAFSEKGTPGFDFVFNRSYVDSLRPYVGLGYQHRIVSRSGLMVVPYAFTRYSRETIADSNVTNLSINGSQFVVAGIQPNRNIVGLGGGLNSQFRQNLDWYLSYNIDLGDRGTNQTAAGGLGFKF